MHAELRPPGSDFTTLRNRRNMIFGTVQQSNKHYKTVKKKGLKYVHRKRYCDYN